MSDIGQFFYFYTGEVSLFGTLKYSSEPCNPDLAAVQEFHLSSMLSCCIRTGLLIPEVRNTLSTPFRCIQRSGSTCLASLNRNSLDRNLCGMSTLYGRILMRNARVCWRGEMVCLSLGCSRELLGSCNSDISLHKKSPPCVLIKILRQHRNNQHPIFYLSGLLHKYCLVVTTVFYHIDSRTATLWKCGFYMTNMESLNLENILCT